MGETGFTPFSVSRLPFLLCYSCSECSGQPIIQHMVTNNSGGSLDEEFPLGDGVADTEADAVCPYCGEVVLLALDPGGGARQEYVEDCEVCCQPWQVSVAFDPEGRAEVAIRQLDA
jgi:hypothetical protein